MYFNLLEREAELLERPGERELLGPGSKHWRSRFGSL